MNHGFGFSRMDGFLGGHQQMTKLLLQFIAQNSRLSKQGALKSHIMRLTLRLREDEDPRKYDALIKNNYPEMLVYTFDTFRRRDPELFRTLLDLLVTVTNNSENFCSALMETNLPDLLVEESLRYCESIFIKICGAFLQSCLMIIFNITRVSKFKKYFLQSKKIILFKNNLKFLLSSNIEDTQVLTMLTLACLKEGANDEMVLLKHLDILIKICKYLSNAVTSEDRAYNLYDVWELLLGLKELSSITSMKPKIIVISEFFNSINTIISSDSSKTKEVEVALEILKNLCGDEEIKKMMKNNLQFKSVVSRLSKSSVESIKDLARHIVRDLQPGPQQIVDNDKTDYDVSINVSETNMSVKLASNLKTKITVSRGKEGDQQCNKVCLDLNGMENFDQGNLKYDVFISCAADDQPMINGVAKLLKRRVKVCMGNEMDQESNNSYEDIDQSKIVVIGLSPSYEGNRYCISEATYAYNKNKKLISLVLTHKFKARGILDEITQKYPSIECSDMSKFRETLAELYKHISEYMGVSGSGNSLNHCGGATNLKQIEGLSKDGGSLNISPSMKSPITSTQETQKHYSSWSAGDVSMWLQKSRLSDVSYKFKEFDGELIKKMKDWQKNSSERYYEHLKTSLKLEFSEILKLDVALDKLTD